MPYVLVIAIVGIAVVLGIFTGIWGGLVWIAVAGLVLAAAFLLQARGSEVRTSNPEPTPEPRTRPPAARTANRRVGQS